MGGVVTIISTSTTININSMATPIAISLCAVLWVKVIVIVHGHVHTPARRVIVRTKGIEDVHDAVTVPVRSMGPKVRCIEDFIVYMVRIHHRIALEVWLCIV